MRKENIFFNIVKNETSLTEIFCNLMQYKPFRDMFIELVNEKRSNENRLNTKSIKYSDFDTEIDLDDNCGRADLKLDYVNEELIFEFKVETYTSLTSNQPTNYLNYLKKQNELNYNSNLYFILPKGYFHFEDICKKWNSFDKAYSKNDIKNKNIFYWEDIIAKIREREVHKLNIIINEFCEILDYRWFYIEHISFTKNELELIFKEKNKNEDIKMLFNPNIPRIMEKLFKIIDEPLKRFSYIEKDDKQNNIWYGYFINLRKYNLADKNINIWFGTDYEIWEKTSSPLIIQIFNDDGTELDKNIMNKLEKNKLKLETYNYKDKEMRIAYFIPLKNDFSDENNVVEKFIEKIEKTINTLKELYPQESED